MKRIFEFTKYRFIALGISAVLILGGIAATVTQGGFNLGIDFQAGLDQRVEISGAADEADVAGVRAALSEVEQEGLQVQSVGPADEQQFSVRVRDRGEIENFPDVMAGRVIGLLEAEFGEGTVDELERSYVGARFTEDLAGQAGFVVFFAVVLILAYIWLRFQLGYALSAISALVHDVTFMLVFIGSLQIEVQTATIAAVLTIIGYSLNDTIVIFDRVRENTTLMRDASYEQIINSSISQSMSRTVITSVTTLLAVTAIFIFATGAIQDFALNLMVGVVVGTYSSVFVASPALLGWKRRADARRAAKEGRARRGEGSRQVVERAKPALEGASGGGNSSGEAASASGAARADVDAVKREISQKKQPAAAGKQQPRSKRKKKK